MQGGSSKSVCTIGTLTLALALGCTGSDGGGTPRQGGGVGGTTNTGGTRTTGGGGSGGNAGAGGAPASLTVDGETYAYHSSCDYRETSETQAGRCRDWYSGPNPPNLSSSCNDIYMREPCPAESRVGQCQLDPVVGVIAIYNYYAPTWTADTARDHCIGGYRSDNKTWIPVEGGEDAGGGDAGVEGGL